MAKATFECSSKHALAAFVALGKLGE